MRPLLRIYTLAILLTSLSTPVNLLAQITDLSNLRTVKIHNQQDTFTLSAFSIAPHTFELMGLEDDSLMISQEFFHLQGGRFIWDQGAPMRVLSDSTDFVATFRILPYDLARWSSRFDSVLYQDGRMRVVKPLQIDPFQGNQTLLGTSTGIQYDGTFSRGLALGNRQDLVLNSNFDLRLSGKLANDIEILAALSDNSIPLQPEGNTQQLQEFDKIFIQLSKDNSRLIGGDYILSKPESHFVNYYKRLQGVRLENSTKVGKYGRIESAAGAGSTRGQFARINVATQEGNQGPYRLRGNSNERFIIILANSERIFLDGKLLTRGLEQDYIIDYNAGELTFTANRIITKDVRIIAEYEYSDQNYNRSIFTVETGYHDRRLDLQFNAYSEQDGKLTSGLADLTAEDKRFLAELGDSSNQAFTSSIRLRPEGYDPNIVMYMQVDTLGYSNVLVRSTNPDNARYTARFTFVGPGRGNYLPIAEEANGAVYAWIQPDSLTGAPLGTFQPEVQLVAPQQRQMFSLGGSYRLGVQGKVFSEVSLSRLDQNRFSTKDGEDDYGYAFRNGVEQTFSLGRDSSESWQIHTEISHEYLSNSFEILKPYRDQEFTRDWNLQGLAKDEEHLANGLIAISKGSTFDLTYRYGGFFRTGAYDGNKHVLQTQLQRGGFAVSGQMDRLQSSSPFFEALFDRPKLDISQGLGEEKDWRLGVYYEREKNRRTAVGADSINISSFFYELGKMYLSKQSGESLGFELSYQRRYDYLPQGSSFARSTSADDIALQGRWNADNKSILDATFTVRNLNIDIPSAVARTGGLNYLGRLSHKFNLGKGALRTSTNYEVSSGQEPRRTFQYLKVNPGQGTYTWIDLNDDGIQQINEFEISPFPEQAEYIRVTIVTNDFISTNNIIYNQSYSLDPSRLLKNRKAVLAKFSDQGSIRIQRKNLQNAQVSLWNPFVLDIADSSLVSVSAQIRNVFYFNRSNPKYDIQYETNDFRNRFILTTGYERKKIVRHILRSRMNFNKELSGLLSLTSEVNEQDSETFDNKDFTIQGIGLNPELTWQPSSKFRLTTKYQFQDKKNVLADSDETASIHDIKIESTFNKVSTSSLRINFSTVLIDFNGRRNSALEFTMLEGLKDGTNWIWGVSYDRKLMSNIRLNLSYDGRKSGEAQVVHTARAQVSAFF